MPTLQFKGKSVIETYHHTVPHHRLEFVPQLSVLANRQNPGLDGSLIIEGDNRLAFNVLLMADAGEGSERAIRYDECSSMGLSRLLFLNLTGEPTCT